MRALRILALSATVLTATTAAADVEIAVGPGDKISGTLEPGTEVERFLAPLPAGAALTLKVKTAKGGPALRLRVLEPAGGPIADVNGTKPSVSKLAIATTGVHVIEVTSLDDEDETGGSYALSVTWTNPKSASISADVASGAEATLVFGAPATTAAKLSVRSSRGSAAVAELVSISGPNAFTTTLGPGTTGAATLPSFGDYTLRFRNAGAAAGGIDAAVALKAPKTAKRKIDLSSRAVTPGVRIVAAALVTAAGATLTSPGGATAGASVTFPAKSVKKPVVATLGEGTQVVPFVDEIYLPAGPPVFLGPEGGIWRGVSVTLPYDPAAFPNGTSTLRVFTRDAEGATSEVTGVTVNGAANTVTFTTTHFSTFQPLAIQASKNATAIARLFYATPESALDRFGVSVGITDAWIAVGSRVSSGGQPDSGAVFVYPFANDVVGPAERIEAPTPERNDRFGDTIAIEGDVLVVGVEVDTPGGSAFVFRRTGNQWALEQELVPSPRFPEPGFGHAVAMHGTRIVVGATGDDNGQFRASGAAYVFAFDGQTWVQEARLIKSTPATQDAFGISVSIHGTTVAVGSYDYSASINPFGDVTVFARNPANGVWSESENLKVPRPSYEFGFSIGLGDGVLVCGQAFEVAGSEGKAFAYAGSPGAFALEETLKGAGPLNWRFGHACAIDGSRMLISAEGGGAQNAPGKVYSYVRDGNAWKREATMRGGDVGFPDHDPIAPAQFGHSVALHANHFLVGALQAPGGPNADKIGAGAAFLFKLDD